MYVHIKTLISTGTPVYNSYYGHGSSRGVWIDAAGDCVGNETDLLSCTWSLNETCTDLQLAGVQCSNPCAYVCD